MRNNILLAATLLLTLLAAAQNNNAGTPAATGTGVVTAPVQAASSWPTAQFAATKDEGVQKAKRILDDMIQALGGDAYLNVRDVKSEGRSYAFWQGKPSGLGVQFWRFWQWPDKDRWELTKQRDIAELNIGDQGYEITYKGTATQDPKNLEEYLRRRDHSMEWVIRKWLPSPGAMILYSGTAIVEQTLTDQVTVLNAANDSVTISVDPRTHLPVEKSNSWRDPLDRQKDEEIEIFSNYRPVQGIQTPMSTVRMQNGEMRNQRFLTSVSYNNGLEPTLFETKGITYNSNKSSQPK